MSFPGVPFSSPAGAPGPDSVGSSQIIDHSVAAVDIDSGAATLGQVLTANGAGGASWETPSGGISGSGTADRITRWTSTSAIGDSSIQDDGAVVTIDATKPLLVDNIQSTSTSAVRLDFTATETNIYDASGAIRITATNSGSVSLNSDLGTPVFFVNAGLVYTEEQTAIGATSVAGAELLRVVGLTRLEGNIQLYGTGSEGSITDANDVARIIVQTSGGSNQIQFYDSNSILRQYIESSGDTVLNNDAGAERLRIGVNEVTASALIVTGDLTVNGTTTTVNSTVVDVADRVIHMNHADIGSVPVPSDSCGFSVHRGDDGVNDRDHAGLFWDETAQEFVFAFDTQGDDTATTNYLNIRASHAKFYDGATELFRIGNGTPGMVSFTDLSFSGAGSGIWIGATGPFGSEKLRVAGDTLLEGKLTVTGAIDPTYIECVQQSSVSAATSGSNRIYFKTDGLMYTKNSSGTESGIVTSSATTFTFGTFFTVNKSSGSGVGNLAAGASALSSLSPSNSLGNTAYGHQTLSALSGTFQSYNVAIGYLSMTAANAATVTQYNVAVGAFTLSNPSTGYIGKCVAIGGNAMLGSGTTSSQEDSVGIGYSALANFGIGGVGNVGVGSYSLLNLTTGSYNVGVGSYSLIALTTGNSNIGLGITSFTAAPTISNCIVFNATPITGTASNTLIIGGITTAWLGDQQATAPTSKTLSVTDVTSGTTNTAGASLTVSAGRSTGNAVGGAIVLQTAPAGTSGTSQNALVERLRVTPSGAVEWTGIATASQPALSGSGKGTIFYDSTLQKFRYSANGAAYADLVGGISGLTTGKIPKAASATSLTDSVLDTAVSGVDIALPGVTDTALRVRSKFGGGTIATFQANDGTPLFDVTSNNAILYSPQAAARGMAMGGSANNAICYATDAIAIGDGARANGAVGGSGFVTVLGSAANSGAGAPSYVTNIGGGCATTATGHVVTLGTKLVHAIANTISIGTSSTNVANVINVNTFAAGTTETQMTTVFFGCGERISTTNTVGPDYKIQGSGGNGTGNGGTLTVAGGIAGAGAGTGGSLKFQTAAAAAGQTLVTRFEIAPSGALGFFAASPATQQTSGANLTNNVTSGGTDDTIDNFTDLTVYANDAASIRNAIYQLSRKLKQINDGLRSYGLFT